MTSLPVRELHDEEIDEDRISNLFNTRPENVDVGGIRTLLIRLAQVEREREANAGIRKAVMLAYDDKDAQLEAAEKRLRNHIQSVVEIVGRVSLPDVGTAYLTQVAGKIDVADDGKAKDYAKAKGIMRQPPLVPDLTALKQSYLDTGEVPPEETGLVFVAAHKALRIRR